ncbi:MAG: hypothetical protein AAGA61_10505 [Pseudomonadota bacterium]
MTEITSMRSALAQADILERVAEALPLDAATPVVEHRVYYPYFRFCVTGVLRWLFGARRINVSCLIDARTGRAATADAFDVETVSVAPTQQLAVQQCVSAGRGLAERYTRHSLGRAFRMLTTFRLHADAGVLIHRPYWVVRASGHRFLVDGVTGEFHPLP